MGRDSIRERDPNKQQSEEGDVGIEGEGGGRGAGGLIRMKDKEAHRGRAHLPSLEGFDGHQQKARSHREPAASRPLENDERPAAASAASKIEEMAAAKQQDSPRSCQSKSNAGEVSGSFSLEKLSQRALAVISLRSRLLGLASGEVAEGRGGRGVFGDSPSQTERSPKADSELKGDVLFYEAGGHYTETGEEYSLPLGEH